MADDPVPISLDAYSPAQMAARVETIGVYKAHMPPMQMTMLGIMAGAFISLGAMNYLFTLAQGMPKLAAAITFCLGLVLVIVGGAELFTSNNLLAMAWAQRKVSTREMLRNWVWIWLANMVGAFGTVAIAYLAGVLHSVDMNVGVEAIKIASSKAGLGFSEAFFRGILCNALVCMAVWLVFAARSVTDKILALIFPITAFVSMGFEHCIANMFIIPLGMLAAADPAIATAAHATPELLATLSMSNFIHNITASTLGNIFGGSVLVALMYYLVYLRPAASPIKPD
jgi:formate transporter